MGYYIETGSNHMKAEWLVKNHQGVVLALAERIDDDDPGTPYEGGMRQRILHSLMKDYDIVVVADNGPFEAAGYAFDEKELDAFLGSLTDTRPCLVVVLPKGVGAELSGYTHT